jgi:acyl carrier protein
MTTPGQAHAEVRELVRQCWATVLELDPGEVEPHSNFFAAGGDSLLAVELVAIIGERLGFEIPLDPLFFEGTFAALSEVSCQQVGPDRPNPAGPGS